MGNGILIQGLVLSSEYIEQTFTNEKSTEKTLLLFLLYKTVLVS
jgi:hypothetical protein